MRLAPVSAVGEDGAIDLRSAVPAAPHTAYQQALLRAAERSGPVLAESGETGPGLPALRSLIAGRYTEEGLVTRPEQILITSGARAALALLTAHLRPRAAAVEIPAYPAVLAGFRASEPAWPASGSPRTAGTWTSSTTRSGPRRAGWPTWSPTSRTRPVRSCRTPPGAPWPGWPNGIG
ncbi:hypothetical protein ACFQY7_19770 [Actinomadura luteofluorescens]|uniref:hypothetical protein n=1 Tax=Actinomadura luteofluorescens TaxID=46163 RepID=UPI00363911B6